MRSGLAASAAFCVLALASQGVAAPPPASAFGRIPAVVQAAISPDGAKVAVLGGHSDERVLSIATLDQPNLPQLRLGDVEAVGVRWAGNGHVLARLAYWEQVTGKVAYRFERTVAVTPQAKAVSRLLDSGANNLLVSQPILGVTAGDKPRVLMTGLMESGGPSGNANTRLARKGEESSWVLALWSVDPATGRGTIVEKGTYDTATWEVDPAGKPRVRLDIDENTHAFSVMGRANDRAQYVQVHKAPSFASRRHYYGFSAPDGAIILSEGGRLMKRRLADGGSEPFGPEVLETNPSLIWDEARAVVVGISTGAEKPTVSWTDPQIGAAHGTLLRVFKDRRVDLAGWSADRTRFVARVSSPSAPGAWYLFDAARKEVSPLGDEYPELKDATLGQTRWISYRARDGLEIPAYLTLPPADATVGKKPPLVVLPHGGPRSRDAYDFDYMVQFLATRGYAVLQPQFRGSWGFGDAFETAGDGEWAGKMQTDLLDGVAALAAQGEVDAGRACIVGASFGGYSALVGAALYPGSYRCAASIAGISDLGQLLLEDGRAYGRDSASLGELRGMIGGAGPLKLSATSPARHAAAVKAPVLLIHGDRDTVVLADQSVRMADALKAAGKPHELVILEGENHYLSRASSRTWTLEAIEAFLAKHLPVT